MYSFNPPISRLSKFVSLPWLLTIFSATTITTVFGFDYFLSYYQNHLPFNTTINSISVENLSTDEAVAKLSTNLPEVEEKQVIISVDDISVASSSSELGYHYDIPAAVKAVQDEYARKNPLKQLLYLGERLQKPHDFTVSKVVEPEKERQFIAELAKKVDVPGEKPTATLLYSGSAASLTVTSGKTGRLVDTSETQEALELNISKDIFETKALVASTSGALNDEQLEAARRRALQFVGYSQVLKHDTVRVYLTDKELVSLLSFPNGYDELAVTELLSSWTTRVERKPQDAIFHYNKDTLQVTQFQPPREGLTLNKEDARKIILDAITTIESSTEKQVAVTKPLELPVQVAQPQVTLAKTNELGIQDRLAVGESWYKGSIPTRIHNVSLAASKIANYIVKPGEEFSFNQALGDVSAATGYQAAYVIMGGKTVLGDGGGVCQVSTTLFRALLNGGLDITRRLPHSYRVGYYEQNLAPGIDATVYSGNVDLRFRNDTPGHLLIHTVVDSKSQYMTVELYGTSDGRSGEITDIKQWDARPAPPAEYFPDPSLAPGQTRQIDWAVGGLKTSFKHIIRDKNGKIIKEQVYTSNYRPWAAKYLQGV